MEKKINLLDIILVILLILACLAAVVTLVKVFSSDNEKYVYRITVDDETAEIIRPGDGIYRTDGSFVGNVVSIGSVGKRKTIDVEAEENVLFKVGEHVGLRTQKIFLDGNVYSVNSTEVKANEE